MDKYVNIVKWHHKENHGDQLIPYGYGQSTERSCDGGFGLCLSNLGLYFS